MSRTFSSSLALALVATQLHCSAGDCTLIGCESKLSVDYGDDVVNEPYTLTINPDGAPISVVCLSDDPDADPLPEWLECDAGGFEITGELAENTTISVSVVPLSTGEALIPSALVPLTVDDTLEPNGPDCGPVCYVRSGSTRGV